MKHTLTLFLFVLTLSSVSCAQKTSPTPANLSLVTVQSEEDIPKNAGAKVVDGIFYSAAGKFSIAVPVMPTHFADQATEKAKAKGIDVGKTFIWSYSNMSVQVFYDPGVNIDGDASPVDFKDIEEGSRKGILNSKSTITSEKSIKYGDHRGIEFRGVYVNGFNFINRTFLIGDRGYQVNGGYKDVKDEKTIIDILDSFKAPIN